MAKTKTSKLQKKSAKKSSRRVLRRHSTNDPGFNNPLLIKQTLIEALMEDDVETFKNVLVAHLRTQSKTKLAAKTNLGRQTLYDLINEDIEFNPTLSTLASILKSIAA